MQFKRIRTRWRAVRAPLAMLALAAAAVMPSSNSSAQATLPYSIELHLVSAGHQELRNSCFILNASVGQPAPGYSSDTTGQVWSVLAGFWAAAPTTARDEIFFDGFEGC